eukprot:4114614-Alexandrium_andersonii.AAC.1
MPQRRPPPLLRDTARRLRQVAARGEDGRGRRVRRRLGGSALGGRGVRTARRSLFGGLSQGVRVTARWPTSC